MMVEGAKPALVSIYDYYDTKDKWVSHIHMFSFKTCLTFHTIIKYLGLKFFTLWRKRKKRRNISTRRLRMMTPTTPMRIITQNNIN